MKSEKISKSKNPKLEVQNPKISFRDYVQKNLKISRPETISVSPYRKLTSEKKFWTFLLQKSSPSEFFWERIECKDSEKVRNVTRLILLTQCEGRGRPVSRKGSKQRRSIGGNLLFSEPT